MRRDELEVGKAYALGDQGRYSQWRHVRVVVVETAGERTNEAGRPEKGIVVRLEPSVRQTELPWAVRRCLRIDDDLLLRDGRAIVCGWEPYERNRDEHQAAAAEREAEMERRETVARVAIALLAEEGIEATFLPARGRVELSVDDLLRLAERFAGVTS